MRRGWLAHIGRVGLAAAIGLVAFFVAGMFSSLPPGVAPAIGWDAAALFYLGRIWLSLSPLPGDRLKAWASEEDDGRAVLTFVLSAAVAFSMVSIFLMVNKQSGGGVIAFAAVTIVISWTLLHTVYAVHYLNRCYGGGQAAPALDFPGKQAPRFIDFAYYSFTIGMTFQTSDVSTKTSDMRKLTLAHGVASFFFNAVIIAISVSLAGSLMNGG